MGFQSMYLFGFICFGFRIEVGFLRGGIFDYGFEKNKINFKCGGILVLLHLPLSLTNGIKI